ncbi:hypothetical protein MICA_2306 [Micavibrio aeruginosavorus ARL-13]|uniref:Uncharacterized protein n=1 Tax=Micavibrio aeruginosavorus (strain ARL-13) TaxID=856793 RepID=G2KT65_MICAA|nr:hypothetical protein MICA_2306 [Micavibrio aeruginosavorus ARL-13]
MEKSDSHPHSAYTPAIPPKNSRAPPPKATSPHGAGMRKLNVMEMLFRS